MIKNLKVKVKSKNVAPDFFCNDKCSPLLVGQNIISVLDNGTIITIWRTEPSWNDRITLVGHDRVITALAVSPSSPTYLCSCSEDKTILWDISGIITDLQGLPPTGSTFGLIGYVGHCSFSWDNAWLALCKEQGIWILKLQLPDCHNAEVDVIHQTTLEMNGQQDIMCAFSPQHPNVLVSVEDSSCFKVWNLQSMTLSYQSPRLTMYTITYCSFSFNHLLLGSNDGTIHVYNVRPESTPCCLMKASVARAFAVKSSRPSTRSEETGSPPRSRSSEFSDFGEESGEAGCIVYNIYMYHRESCSREEARPVDEEEDVPGFTWDTSHILKSILAPGPVVLVCCSLGIALYDCYSWDCLATLVMQDMVPVCSPSLLTFPLLNFMLVGGGCLNDLVCVMKTSIGSSRLHVVTLTVVESSSENKAVVLPREPVTTKSPLQYQLLNKVEKYSEYKTRTAPMKTYKTACRSSGYGKTAPRVQMFVPNIAKNKSRNGAVVRKQVNKPVSSDLNSDTLIHCGPPVKVKEKICVWDTSGTAIHLAVSSNGKYLACSSTSSLICILKFCELNADKSLVLIGHDAAINSLHYSLSSQWLVSSSDDCTVKVWDWRNKRCMLNIDKRCRNNKVLGKPKKDYSVCSARFFYMDQFILMTRQHSLELYAHILHETAPGARTLDSKTCRRIREISIPTQQVTCFSAINQFHSYLALCGCSNRTVQVYDLNAERFALELRDVHSRPPHQLRQMEGSAAVSHPAAMMDLFVTSALCDSTKLWDLRSSRCVQKYSQHVSRAYTSGIDISPCGRYVAVSSEDKCVYVYDTRKCSEHVGKLCGLGEVVMDVCFNPCKPVLVAAALNGDIASYT